MKSFLARQNLKNAEHGRRVMEQRTMIIRLVCTPELAHRYDKGQPMTLLLAVPP